MKVILFSDYLSGHLCCSNRLKIEKINLGEKGVYWKSNWNPDGIWYFK